MSDPASNPSPSNKTPAYPGGVKATRKVGGSKRRSIAVPKGKRSSKDASATGPGRSTSARQIQQSEPDGGYTGSKYA